MDAEEGFVMVDGYRLFYKSFGVPTGNKTILCAHGGPGATHDYILPLADLSNRGYRVVLFDFLGCGRSEVPSDPSLYTLAHNVLELEGVRSGLKLGRVHLYGRSCGGIAALEYALSFGANLRSLILSGAVGSVPQVVHLWARMREQLPDKTQQVLAECERTGDLGNPRYLEAIAEFERPYAFRAKTRPVEYLYTRAHTSKEVFRTMWGPTDWVVTGNMKAWTVLPRLHEILVPALLLYGKFDYVPLEAAISLEKGLPLARLVVLENSTHNGMWEQRSEYIEQIDSFLSGMATL